MLTYNKVLQMLITFPKSGLNDGVFINYISLTIFVLDKQQGGLRFLYSTVKMLRFETIIYYIQSGCFGYDFILYY